MRRQRGSAYIFVLMMVIAITIIALAVSDMSTAFAKAQTRAESRAKADAALSGAMDKLDADRAKKRIRTPYNDSFTIGTVPVAISAVDYMAIPGCMEVTATCEVAGKTYYDKAYIVRDRFSPYFYALASNSDIETGWKVVAGSGGELGSVFANDDINLTDGSSVINGDAEAGDTINAGLSVTGEKNRPVPPLSFTDLSNEALYDAAATTLIVGNSTKIGHAFAAVPTSSSYNLVVVTGNLIIKGTISGCGTFFVKGNLIINGPMSYANAGSKVAFLVKGNVEIDPDDTVGFIYTKSGANIKNGGLLGTDTSGDHYGTIAARGDIDFDRNLGIVLDPWIADNPREATRMRMPGYWP